MKGHFLSGLCNYVNSYIYWIFIYLYQTLSTGGLKNSYPRQWNFHTFGN